jgi:hypothetical protein
MLVAFPTVDIPGSMPVPVVQADVLIVPVEL